MKTGFVKWGKRRLALFGLIKVQTDPLRFDDPIALRVGWEPLSCNSSLPPSFSETSTFIFTKNKAVFQVSKKRNIFYSSVCSMIVTGIGLSVLMSFSKEIPIQSLVTLALICFFSVAILLFFIIKIIIITFDLSSGIYHKGKRTTSSINKKFCYIRDIHAIQLVNRIHSTGKGAVLHYELNLVLKDATRLFVQAYLSEAKVLSEAKKLTKFLKVPLWENFNFKYTKQFR